MIIEHLGKKTYRPLTKAEMDNINELRTVENLLLIVFNKDGEVSRKFKFSYKKLEKLEELERSHGTKFEVHC